MNQVKKKTQEKKRKAKAAWEDVQVTHDDASDTSYQFRDIVGAMREPSTGNVLVAVVWEHDNPTTGGTWEPIENVNVLQDPPQQDADDTEEGACNKTQALELATRHMRWQDNFGSGLTEGTELLCVWQQEVSKAHSAKAVQQAFKAKLAGDFAFPWHLISYPKQEADPIFGTSKSKQDKHYLNLSTLAPDLSNWSTSGSNSTSSSNVHHLFAWVKLEFATIEFIQDKLKLTCKPPDLAAASRRLRKRNCSQIIFSDSDE